MAYFIWADDMSVGNPQLDHDHQKLVELVNELHTATCSGEGRGVVGEVLQRLVTYTKEHFQREEHYMEQVQYAKTIEHKRQHQTLLKKVQELQARHEAGHVTVAAQASSLLRDWLSVHIRREDKQLAAVMKTKVMKTARSARIPDLS